MSQALFFTGHIKAGGKQGCGLSVPEVVAGLYDDATHAQDIAVQIFRRERLRGGVGF
ncbi:MAG: hypothetical protein WCG66_02475 [bacterium]